MHEIETLPFMGGPLKEKITVSERKPTFPLENQLPESKPKEFEQPGDRSRELMQTLADEQSVLNHPWLAFFPLTPYALCGIENILYTADSTLKRPAAKTVETPNADDVPFTSTSLTGCIWNGLKRWVNPPARQIGAFFTKALSTFGDSIKQGVRIITGPFIRNRRIIAFENSITAVKNLIAQKYNDSKVKLAQRVASGPLKIDFINNLERKLRAGHPSSETCYNPSKHCQKISIRACGTLITLIAENSQALRNIAQKYNGIQRIDPIIPRDPKSECSIHDAHLRADLAKLAQGWPERRALVFT